MVDVYRTQVSPLSLCSIGLSYGIACIHASIMPCEQVQSQIVLNTCFIVLPVTSQIVACELVCACLPKLNTNLGLIGHQLLFGQTKSYTKANQTPSLQDFGRSDSQSWDMVQPFHWSHRPVSKPFPALQH